PRPIPFSLHDALPIYTYIKPSLVPGCFASGLPARQAAVIAATQRPLAASTLSEPSGTPAWKTIPSWAVIGTADKDGLPGRCPGGDRKSTRLNSSHVAI